MKYFSTIIIIILLTIFSKSGFSQNTDSTSTEIVRPFQLTFISPLGTNGLECGKITNVFSINLFSGYSGGLKGIEFGGFANVVKGEVQGVQFAGFSNVVVGNLNGGQFCGFSNVVNGNSKGVQVCGFSNVSKKGISGVQVCGFSNISAGNTHGAQIAGFSNFTTDTLEGIQISSFLNTAKSVKGTQIGFINVTKKLEGNQFGFINISDTAPSGIAIGFLSFIKNGYRKLEIGGGETFHANVAFKLGVQKFYNEIALGANFQPGKITFGAGYGLGTELNLGQKSFIDFELINYSLVDRMNWLNFTYNYSYDYGNITKFNITVSRQFAKHLTIFAGPSVNMAISSLTDLDGTLIHLDITPKSFYSVENNYFLTDFYFGFVAGVRI